MGSNMRTLSFLAFIIIFIVTTSEAKSKKITKIFCWECISEVGQPSWCLRGTYKGKVKQCVGVKADQPANTCYKSVNMKTKVVNQGCAPPGFNRGTVSEMDTGFDGNPDVRVHLCNRSFCNSGLSQAPLLGLYVSSLVVLLAATGNK